VLQEVIEIELMFMELPVLQKYEHDMNELDEIGADDIYDYPHSSATLFVPNTEPYKELLKHMDIGYEDELREDVDMCALMTKVVEGALEPISEFEVVHTVIVRGYNEYTGDTVRPTRKELEQLMMKREKNEITTSDLDPVEYWFSMDMSDNSSSDNEEKSS
jgi:hypothetical protein